jgi:hypothetical protein
VYTSYHLLIKEMKIEEQIFFTLIRLPHLCEEKEKKKLHLRTPFLRILYDLEVYT